MTKDFVEDAIEAANKEGEPIFILHQVQGKVELRWTNTAKVPLGVDPESVSGRQWVDLFTGRINELMKEFLAQNGK